MTVAYKDALQQVLEAVRRGQEIDAAVARFPEHATALRDDARLSEGLSRLASAVAAPAQEARAAASRRMQMQLAAERTASAKPGWSLASLGWPRYVLAAAVVLIAVLGAGLLLNGGGATVEAATIEGVVVENQDGLLTVQTLDALEQVRVPGEALVSDVAGASIGLGGIEVGQVVVIDVERRGRDVVARRVQRYRESIEAWCTDDSARCQALTAGLEQAQRQCLNTPVACRVALDRLEALRLRASDSARLEELKQRCRSGEGEACRLIVTFCREHLVLCGVLAPGEPPPTDRPAIENRLRVLLAACEAGDEAACRQVAAGCDRFADLCPADVPLPPSSSSSGVEVRPQETATPMRPLEMAPAASDAAEPTDTPVRDGESTPAPPESTATSMPSDSTATPQLDVSATPADRPATDSPR